MRISSTGVLPSLGFPVLSIEFDVLKMYGDFKEKFGEAYFADSEGSNYVEHWEEFTTKTQNDKKHKKPLCVFCHFVSFVVNF
jgi:hypothetical protein